MTLNFRKFRFECENLGMARKLLFRRHNELCVADLTMGQVFEDDRLTGRLKHI